MTKDITKSEKLLKELKGAEKIKVGANNQFVTAWYGKRAKTAFHIYDTNGNEVCYWHIMNASKKDIEKELNREPIEIIKERQA